MPEVSIVTSTHNRSGYLQEALASALGQRDVDLELIVVDNGSTDDTPALLDGIKDRRLSVVRHEVSVGATRGRNAGLALATGDWVGLLDDDDLWAPDKVRAQVDEATASGRNWVYTGCVYIDAQRKILGGVPPLSPEEIAAVLPVRFVVPAGMSNVLWRRGFLDENGLLDERLTFTTDWDLSLRLSRQGQPAMVAQPLIAYRQHSSNLSQQTAVLERELEIIGQKFADLRGGRAIDYAVQQRFVGSTLLRTGSRSEALTAYYRGLRGGDTGSLVRALALLTPLRAQPLLRRLFLSDRRWLRDAREWLQVLPDHPPALT